MNVSRRNFLSGATILGAGVVLGGLAGCSAPKVESKESANQGDGESSHNPVKSESFDIVVVGSGTAGTCAALRAAELGASVLCVEKNTGLCGTSAFAEGLCGINTHFQSAQDISIDELQVVKDTMEYHHYACSGPVVKKFVGECGRVVDWVEGQGITYASVAALGDSYPVWHLPAGESGPTTMKSVLDILQSKAMELGVEFRTECPMTGIVTSNGSVAGVFITQEKEEIQVDAKAVILATGGYANSPEMFEEFTGRPYYAVHVWGMEGRDGDGISLAVSEAGADTHIPSAVMYHTGMLDGTSAFSDVPNFVLTMQPTLRVNETGERYFNEGVTSNFSACGNVLTTQAENCFMLFDGCNYRSLLFTNPLFRGLFHF